MQQTVSRVAKEGGGSESLVRRSFTDVTLHCLGLEEYPQAARMMRVDEFAVRKRMFDTLTTDLLNTRVLGVVGGRSKEKLGKYSAVLPDPDMVKVIMMDMHEPFRQAAELGLPRANIVVDKFHVIRRINEALDRVRTRLQGEVSKGRRRSLLRHRYLMLRGAEQLPKAGQEKPACLLQGYPQLQRVLALKEVLRWWCRSQNP